MRQLQLQAVTQWDSQWDLRVFFPNNAGLLPALTEAPWKEFGTGESGATDPIWGLVCDFFMQGYKPALQIGQYQLPHSEGPMPTCRPYHRSDWIEFADSLNSWIPRVVFSFCYLSRGIRIWCSLPPLPAWLVLSTLKRWSSACQHVACTQQPLWICRNESAPLTGGLHGPMARLPFPPTHLGCKNSICFARQDFLFRRGHHGSAVFHCILQPLTLHIFATTASAMVLSLLCNHWQFLLGCFKRACIEDSLDQQQATNPARRWQGRYAGYGL